MGRTDERRWKDRGEKMKDEGDKIYLDRRGRTDDRRKDGRKNKVLLKNYKDG